MSWSIYLWNYPNSSCFSVGYDASEIILTVNSIQIAVLAEFRNSWNKHRETILIHDVPMQDIQLHIEHSVYQFFDCSQI